MGERVLNSVLFNLDLVCFDLLTERKQIPPPSPPPPLTNDKRLRQQRAVVGGRGGGDRGVGGRGGGGVGEGVVHDVDGRRRRPRWHPVVRGADHVLEVLARPQHSVHRLAEDELPRAEGPQSYTCGGHNRTSVGEDSYKCGTESYVLG